MDKPDIEICDQCYYVYAPAIKCPGCKHIPLPIKCKNVKPIDINEMIAEGALVRPAVFVPTRIRPQLSTSQATDFFTGKIDDLPAVEVVRLMDRHTQPDTVDMYVRHANGKQAIAFCMNVAHAEAVALQFQAEGIPAEPIHSKLTNRRKTDRVGRFNNGTTKVLCCTAFTLESLNLKRVGCTIHLAPTRSVRVWILQTSTAMRPVYADGFDLDTREGRLAAIAASDKPEAIILDLAENSLSLGLPTDTHEPFKASGFVAPDADTVIIPHQPTASLNIYMQQSGRGKRPAYPPNVLERASLLAATMHPYAPIEGNAYHNSQDQAEKDRNRQAFVSAFLSGFEYMRPYMDAVKKIGGIMSQNLMPINKVNKTNDALYICEKLF